MGNQPSFKVRQIFYLPNTNKWSCEGAIGDIEEFITDSERTIYVISIGCNYTYNFKNKSPWSYTFAYKLKGSSQESCVGCTKPSYVFMLRGEVCHDSIEGDQDLQKLIAHARRIVADNYPNAVSPPSYSYLPNNQEPLSIKTN